MSQHPKSNRSNHPPAASAPRWRNIGTPFIAVALVALAALAVWRWQTGSAASPRPAAPLVGPQTAPAPPPSAAPAAHPEFQKLKGKWERPDGGYVIEIKSVTDAGAVDAGYFNPKSIHVAKAEASITGTALALFIELRDVNYPGSTYTLIYDAGSDQLKGIYFQAVQRQKLEVEFVRVQ